MAKNTVGSDGLTNQERYAQGLAEKEARRQAFLKTQQQQQKASVAGAAADSSGLTFGGGGGGGATSSSWGTNTAVTNPNNVTSAGMFSGNPNHFVTGGSTSDYSGQLNGLFNELLGRDIKQTGLDYWSNDLANGASIDDVRANIMRGQEYANYQNAQNAADNTGLTFGGESGRNQPGVATDYSGQLSDLYNQLLGRDIRQTGLDYWSNDLANGASMDDIRANVMRSQEYADYQNAQNSNSGSTNKFERATDEQINDIYMKLFGRPVAATGLEYWGNWSEQYDSKNLERAILAGAQPGDRDKYYDLKNNNEADARNAAFMDFIKSLGLDSLVDLFNGNVNLSGSGLAGPNASASTYTPYNPYEQSIGQVDYNSMLLGQNSTGYDPYRGLYNVPDAMKSTADQLGLFNYVNSPQATPAAPYNPMAGLTVPTIDYNQLDQSKKIT